MYIQKIVISNYRNFKYFEIDLNPFTLIIGENNIGKTNLLNAIGLVFSQDITFFRKRSLDIDDINNQAKKDFKEDIVNSVPFEKIRFVTVKVEIFLSGFTTNSKETVIVEENSIIEKGKIILEKQEAVVGDWFIDEALQVAKLTYCFSLKEDLKEWINEQRKKKLTIDQIDQIDFPIRKYGYTIFGGLDESKQVDFYFLGMLKFEFLDALRDAKTQLIASGDYRLLYKILCNLGDNKFDDIKCILKDLQGVVEVNETLDKLKGDISKFLNSTSLVEKEEMNKVDFEFTKIEENEILKKLSLVYGNSPVTVDRNGLGRNNLLYISLILSHLITTDDEYTCFRIVAIEEPEAHLHPHLQQHLAKNIQTLTNENLQILVTSHSTHITSKLDLENTAIIYYDENDDIIKNHYILSKFENSKGKIDADSGDSIQYLKRFLDATKSTMFFARKIILVEGIAEKTLIPKFFEIHTKGITLEKAGISLVNVNGVSFKHFLRVIENGYFVKCLALTDRDSNTRQKYQDRADDLKKDYEGDGNTIKVEISKESTFEIDIIKENKDEEKSSDILLKAIKLTRPQSGGDEFAKKFKTVKDVDSFFGLIEGKNSEGKKTANYKSEFADDLLQVLNENDNCFNIPEYIKEGFEFIFPLKNASKDEAE